LPERAASDAPRGLPPGPSPSKTHRGEDSAMILLIDNYDSFTFNLVHYLGGLGAKVAVYRNDKISVVDALASELEAIRVGRSFRVPSKAVREYLSGAYVGTE